MSTRRKRRNHATANTQREQGVLQQDFIERVTTLSEILDEARAEDFTISTEDRSVTDVAREVLLRAGWISE